MKHARISTRLFYFCSDIALISVGITSEVNEDFLAAISGDAGATNGELGYDYFKSPDFQTLNSILETVSQGICTRTRRVEGNCNGVFTLVVSGTRTDIMQNISHYTGTST